MKSANRRGANLAMDQCVDFGELLDAFQEFMNQLTQTFTCGRSIEHIVGPVGLALLAFVVFGGLALWLFMKRHEERLLLKAEAAIPGPLTH